MNSTPAIKRPLPDPEPPVRFVPVPVNQLTAAQHKTLLAVLKRIAVALEHIANGVNR